MKVIGSICLSYGTEQSIVQQIPPFDDEVYHIYTQLLPLDQIEGDSQAQYIGGKALCNSSPRVGLLMCVTSDAPPPVIFRGTCFVCIDERALIWI